MLNQEALTNGVAVGGIEPMQVVTIFATVPVGNGAIQVVYKTADGALKLEAVKAYADAANKAEATHAGEPAGPAWRDEPVVSRMRSGSKSKPPPGTAPTGSPSESKARSFISTVGVKASTAKMQLVQITEKILLQLVSDPQAVVNVTVEISAEFPSGVSDQVKRAVSENATILGFKNKTWEKA